MYFTRLQHTVVKGTPLFRDAASCQARKHPPVVIRFSALMDGTPMYSIRAMDGIQSLESNLQDTLPSWLAQWRPPTPPSCWGFHALIILALTVRPSLWNSSCNRSKIRQTDTLSLGAGSGWLRWSLAPSLVLCPLTDHTEQLNLVPCIKALRQP